MKIDTHIVGFVCDAANNIKVLPKISKCSIYHSELAMCNLKHKIIIIENIRRRRDFMIPMGKAEPALLVHQNSLQRLKN